MNQRYPEPGLDCAYRYPVLADIFSLISDRVKMTDSAHDPLPLPRRDPDHQGDLGCRLFAGASAETLVERWKPDLARFRERRAPILLY